MAAELVEITDAVAAVINDATLSESVAAVRSYQPEYKLSDLADGEYRVDVMPRGRAGVPLDRKRIDRNYVVEVAIQRKLAEPTRDALDACMELVEEIEALFWSADSQRRLAGYEDAICVAAVNDPAFSPEMLEDDRTFASLLTLTFRVMR